MYVLEVHTDSKRKKRRVPDRFTPYRDYFKTKGEKKELMRLSRKMRRKGYFTVLYDERFSRSEDYRELFFMSEEPQEGGLYRCVYCGKLKSKDDITVDHIIPVGAVKRGKGRFLLGSRDVNDLSNLVPACERCNERKSDHIGLWPLKARLGRYPSYFFIRRVLIALFVAGLIYLLYRLGLLTYTYNLVTGKLKF